MHPKYPKVEQTKQSFQASIPYAKKPTGCIFITIMDSAARIHRHGLASLKQFNNFRKIHPASRWVKHECVLKIKNILTEISRHITFNIIRYILINLGRHMPTWKTNPCPGVLEICGLTPNVLSLVKAFINRKFDWFQYNKYVLFMHIFAWQSKPKLNRIRVLVVAEWQQY